MLLSVCLTLMGLLLAPQGKPSAPPVVTNGHGQFRVIRFPQRWLESGGRRGELITTREYEIRQGERSSQNELLFGALSLESHRYSRNLYAVSTGSSTMRLVPRQRWEKAERVDTQSEPIFPISGYDKPKGIYEHEGRRYAETGKSGGRATLSPNKKYLAVMSYTDAFQRPQLIPPIGGGEALRGTAYWEVYATQSGTRVLSGQMSYSGQSAGIMFSSAVWVDEKYFVLPLDNQYQSFLIGQLPH